MTAFNPAALAFGLAFLALGLFGLARVRRLVAAQPRSPAVVAIVAIVSPALILAGLLFASFAFFPPDF